MVETKNKIKDQVKHLAESIKLAKKELKLAQQTLSGVQSLNIPYHSGREKIDREFGTYTDVVNKQARVLDLKDAFRIKHIVNSMIRGRGISQIEPKVSDNEYDASHRRNLYSMVKMQLREMGYDWRQ